ncbi:hypothetical protein FJTKL_11447 [Diaporthe vaccinii]|uniref:Uncharacterized protein n=1 Tax=Diaporthe vaccinii TaxID=105482 RepID=A0ABR4EH94_9PEZI
MHSKERGVHRKTGLCSAAENKRSAIEFRWLDGWSRLLSGGGRMRISPPLVGIFCALLHHHHTADLRRRALDRRWISAPPRTRSAQSMARASGQAPCLLIGLLRPSRGETRNVIWKGMNRLCACPGGAAVSVAQAGMVVGSTIESRRSTRPPEKPARRPRALGHRLDLSTLDGWALGVCNPFVYACTPSGVSSSPSSRRMPAGAHKLSALSHTHTQTQTQTHSRTVQYARGVLSVSVDGWVGHLCPGVPYRTLYPMAGMPKKLERLHCPRCLPLTAVAKQKGETRACVIATGLWVP